MRKTVCLCMLLVLIPFFAGEFSYGLQDRPSSTTIRIAPLFVENRSFASTLMLANPAQEDAQLQVTVRSLTGALLTTTTIEIPGHSQRSVPIGPLLQTAASAESIGSLSLQSSTNVHAQLSIAYREYPDASYVNEDIGISDDSNSQVLRAVVASRYESAILAISSSSDSPQNITAECYPEHGAAVVTRSHSQREKLSLLIRAGLTHPV